jgi:hypothetical protein
MLADRLQGSEQLPQNEVKAPVTQAAQDDADLREYVQGLQTLYSDPAINDPQMVEIFNSSLEQCFSAETPEAKESVRQLSAVLTTGGLSLMSSVVPKILAHYMPEYFEQLAPGLMEQHRSATAHNTWHDLRASNPTYRNLPDVDTPAFDELRHQVIAENPWITTITFKDANGNALNPWHPQSVRQQAALFAKLACGEKLTLANFQKAIETGRREALGHNRRVSASKSLKSGRSVGLFQRAEANDFRDAILAYNRAARPTNNEEE